MDLVRVVVVVVKVVVVAWQKSPEMKSVVEMDLHELTVFGCRPYFFLPRRTRSKGFWNGGTGRGRGGERKRYGKKAMPGSSLGSRIVGMLTTMTSGWDIC